MRNFGKSLEANAVPKRTVNGVRKVKVTNVENRVRISTKSLTILDKDFRDKAELEGGYLGYFNKADKIVIGIIPKEVLANKVAMEVKRAVKQGASEEEALERLSKATFRKIGRTNVAVMSANGSINIDTDAARAFTIYPIVAKRVINGKKVTISEYTDDKGVKHSYNKNTTVVSKVSLYDEDFMNAIMTSHETWGQTNLEGKPLFKGKLGIAAYLASEYHMNNMPKPNAAGDTSRNKQYFEFNVRKGVTKRTFTTPVVESTSTRKMHKLPKKGEEATGELQVVELPKYASKSYDIEYIDCIKLTPTQLKATKELPEGEQFKIPLIGEDTTAYVAAEGAEVLNPEQAVELIPVTEVADSTVCPATAPFVKEDEVLDEEDVVFEYEDEDAVLDLR